jgi:two-component system nitrogen regulation sensor histidine kinase NtrY
MSIRKKYRGYSLKSRIFYGFLLVCLLSVFGCGLMSYFILKDHLEQENRTELQKGTEEIMGAFDYALSHREMETHDLPLVLSNKIMEIADINKQDIVVFDLEGNYLLSNKENDLKIKHSVSNTIIQQLLKTNKRVDLQSYDSFTKNNITSSYLLLKNNMLKPIAVIYLPYYHNDSKYVDFFDQYLKYIILVDILILASGIWISWRISTSLANTLTEFSNKIRRLPLCTIQRILIGWRSPRSCKSNYSIFYINGYNFGQRTTAHFYQLLINTTVCG